MGGKEKTTLKEMSEILGKETIDSYNTSETRGRELSHGLNYQKLGKDMTDSDLLDMHYFLTEDDDLDDDGWEEGFYIDLF